MTLNGQRSLQDIIIVDNREDGSVLNIENHIPILDFYGD